MERLTDEEIMQLATYNSEVARGLIHTDVWKAKMADRQWQFNREYRSGDNN